MDDVRAFLDASEAFFGALAAVGWGALGLAVGLHLLRLAFRVRGWQNILRASYPGERIPYWRTFGAYVAGVGVNAIVPARGGDVVKLYLVKHRAVPKSSYPTLASSLVVETLFDFVLATALFLWALQAWPPPGNARPALARAFDWSFVVEHPRIAAFFGSLLVGGAILLAAWASRHVTAFKEKLPRRVRDPRRLARVREGGRVLAGGELGRPHRVDVLLPARLPRRRDRGDDAWRSLVVQGLSTVLPFTPGGAGTQQAVLVFSLGGAASRSTILAFGFGQQLVITIVNVALGFGAILLMLRTLRWRGT